MSKYGLLITSPVGPDKNIGDYVQSLAALQFIPAETQYDFIEKEKISEYDSSESVKCIMNAWYIWHPENWPPKEKAINPLLTSIHISPLTATEMLANGGKEYLLSHGPVGCRDTGTLKILEKNGVPCFFSACLTLTLGEKYKNNGNRTGVIFVDPYFPPIRYVNEDKTIYYPLNLIKSFLYFIRTPKTILKLSHKRFFKGRFKLQTYYNASMFYHAYSNMFDDETLMNAEYISHMVPSNANMSQQDWLEIAETLIKKYSKAKYVVTSRIHCALPCLGLETPVIFVLENIMDSKDNIFNAPGRFGGLMDFFRVASYFNNKVHPVDDELKKAHKLSPNYKFSNQTNWKIFRDRLIKQVRNFMEG